MLGTLQIMYSAGEEAPFVDERLQEAGINDTLQRAFSREKTKRFVSRNIEDNVEDITSYKKRAEMLEREETSKNKDVSTPKEQGRVPPNSPNNDEFEFDCWDYFSSIFFQLYPDSGKRTASPKFNRFCRENSLDMRKELEWRASREILQESIGIEDDNGKFVDKVPSRRKTGVKFEETSRNVKVKQKPFHAGERRYLTEKYCNEVRHQNNRYKLVLPEKPRNLYPQSPLNRERRKDIEIYKSMASTYKELKDIDFKKPLKLGSEQKQTMSFTDDNTCTVYFPDSKQGRQTVPATALRFKANLTPRTVQRKNNKLSGVIKTTEEDKNRAPEKAFDSEVKKYLVTCSFRLNSKKEEKRTKDIPKDIQKPKSLHDVTNKLTKPNRKDFVEVGNRVKTSVEFSPVLSKQDTKTRKPLFAEEERDDKMSKYRKNSQEQDFLEKTQVLELKTRQFEFPVFQKGEVLCSQVKRVTFAPLPILTSKFAYEKKDYDAWSRTDKKSVKPIEIKWKA